MLEKLPRRTCEEGGREREKEEFLLPKFRRSKPIETSYPGSQDRQPHTGVQQIANRSAIHQFASLETTKKVSLEVLSAKNLLVRLAPL